MSRIRGRNTSPEMKLRKVLWQKGLRYRISHGLVGKPDIVFVSARLVVFIDGCFWHSCPHHSTLPKSNRAFWKAKLSKNIRRDRTVTKQLQRSGWKVLRFWEHELKESSEKVVAKILKALESEKP